MARVSTPFFYAKGILADGRGMFCKFRDSASIADCITRLLSNHDRGFEMRMNTYKYCKRFIWPKELRRSDQAMTRNAVTTSEHASYSEAKQIYKSRGVRHLPVVDGRRHFVGMLSTRSIHDALVGV